MAAQGSIISVTSSTDSSAPGDLTVTIPVMPTQVHRIGQGNRVLLVDDTAVTRQLGDSMLRSLGVQVDVADGGQAAIDAVAAHPYGLVLMDIRMPDLDGLIATHQIRSSRAGGSTVTDHRPHRRCTPRARERALMVGMDDFVTKPFSRQSRQSVGDRYLHAEPTPAT